VADGEKNMTSEQNNLGRLRITLLKSVHGRLKAHRACVQGLGLRRRHHTVEIIKTPENLGMVRQVAYMLKIEEVSDAS
jgi:large subunit ribosomal protein L30